MPLLIATMLLVSCADDIDAVVQPPSTAVTISGTLPVMYIETENRTPITSKTEYLDAKYWLDPLENSEYDALGSESEPLPMQIRGRGHSSWKGAKKPYKIKFAKKTSVMGMPKNI